jgi:ferredoxin/flavodoxin---NADP+ reductase
LHPGVSGRLHSTRGWQAIDEAERDRGRAASRPRVKFVEVGEMLSVGAAD